MKTYNHLSDSKRNNIALFLNDGKSIGYIAEKLNVTKSTVQREIIRNRRKIEDKMHFGKCPLLKHKCSVCNACKMRHKCMLVQYIYHDDGAIRSASIRKHTANSGPRIPLADFLKIDDELYDLVSKKGHSVEAAWQCSEVLQMVSSLTLRRWIYNGHTKTLVIHLRRKKTYQNKGKYDYSKEKISLNYKRMPLRTIEDYMRFMKEHPDSAVIQTDSVEGKTTDRLAVLTVFHAESKLQVGYLYNRSNSSNEVYGFLRKHTRLLLDSIKGDRPIVFVTDNGVEFASISRLEKMSPRVKVFFARPYCSTDKAGCERNHEFYRYVCPKGYSFDKFTQETVNGVFSNINSYIRESLKWKSPCQIVTETLGDAFLKGTGLTMISPKDVVLRPLF